jgi:cobalamin biosynthesis protein CbiG
MTSADNIRNSIIDKLLTISNKEYLSALYQLVSTSKVDEEIIQLSEAQILMLNRSEDDIKNNRLMSQDELDKMDLEWLKSL